MTPTEQTGLKGFDAVDQRLPHDVRDAVERLLSATGTASSVSIELTVPPLEHIGLGSKTAIVLAALQATTASLGLSASQTQLQRLSQRGGTSGVGIHGFFAGGFLVDGGQAQGDVSDLLPSSAQAPEFPPCLLSRFDVPSDWRFTLLQAEGPRIAGGDEVAFFRTSTPIPRDEVLDSISLTMHGLAPAVATADLDAFGVALTGLRETGFKRREVEAQSTTVRNLLTELQSRGIPAGLSSMGPLVFAVSSEKAQVELDGLGDLLDVRVLGTFPARNRGAEIRGVHHAS